MYIHPELARRLAQAKIEEAQARAQRASLVRAALLERREPGNARSTSRHRWAALMPRTVRRSRARRRIAA